MVEVEQRIQGLRARGARIGQECILLTDQFSTEPYLVELGDGVAVAGGTMFITHDGTARMLRCRGRSFAQHLGRITVGNNTFIAQNCLILPGTTIGTNCIIGAGAVVRGKIPDDSVVIGNPAKVVDQTSLLLARMNASPDTLDCYHLLPAEREALIRRHFGLA
jgi:acetyltransferase-like isoleucine patch superfamily enzyme